MKVRFQVMLQSGERMEKRLQSVTGELPFVEMLSGKKEVNATPMRFKKQEGNQLMAAQRSDIY